MKKSTAMEIKSDPTAQSMRCAGRFDYRLTAVQALLLGSFLR